jgi:hypothetical protein
MPNLGRDSTRSEFSPLEPGGVDLTGGNTGVSAEEREYIESVIEEGIVQSSGDPLAALRVAKVCIDRKIVELERTRPTPPGGGGAARDQEGCGEPDRRTPMASPQQVRGGGLFSREQAIYEARKADLLATHEGEFVVIKGDEVAGVWPTFEEALRGGYARFGLPPFLVKQILAVDPVFVVTRDVRPCRT